MYLATYFLVLCATGDTVCTVPFLVSFVLPLAQGKILIELFYSSYEWVCIPRLIGDYPWLESGLVEFC